MRKFYALLSLLFVAFAVDAQISVTGNTNTTPALQTTYVSLSAAFSDLNAVTAMSGAVTLTCIGGGSESAPATGLTLGSATLNPVLSSSNTITINTSGGTYTLNAGTGTATPGSAAPDGILKLVGADYVTVNGLTFTDGNASNPASMEFGLALFKRAAGDGSNNNTIQNCTFNMQRINNASGTAPMIDGAVGILVINSIPTAATTSLTPTNGGALATNGTNSGNKFYGNTINGGNIGVGLSGFAATAGVGPAPTATTFLGDLGNDVGGSALGTGNTILNFGGGAAANAAAGIRANNEWSINISYNSLNNNNGSGVNHATTLRGIYAQAGTSANATINNNAVTIHGGASASQTAFIENAIGSTAAANTISINNNSLTGDYLTATTGVFYGIYNTAAPATINIQNNNVSGLSYSAAALTGSGVVYPIYSSGAATSVNASSNTVNNITRTGTTGATTIGIFVSSGTTQTVNQNTVSNMSIDGAGTASIMYGIQTAGTTVTCNNNNVNNLQVIKTSGTGAIYGVYNFASPTNENYNNNDVHTLTHNGTGIVYGIYANTAAGVRTTSGNLVYNLSTGGTTIAGISMALSSPNIFKNKVYDVLSTSTGAPIVSGIILLSTSTGSTANIYNNLIGDLRAPAALSIGTVTVIRGLYLAAATGTSNFNVSFNTVYLNASSSSANFGTTAFYASGSTTATSGNLTLRNNILVNNSTAAGSGLTISYQRSTVDLNNYATASNNNLFFSGSPSATYLIFYDGTNSDQSISTYKTRVAPRDANSVTENPPFLSTAGSSANFLHINPSIATQVEGGGAAISGITDDYDGDSRNGTTPDIGADEGSFTLADFSGPSIVYTALPNTGCLTAPSLSATITDPSGVNLASGTKPRLYFKRSTDANTFNDNTSGTDGWKYVEASNGTSPFNFNFDYSLLNGGTGVANGQTIQYFIVAQDLLNNVSINTGTFATQPLSVALTSAAFPITGIINSYSLLTGITGTVTVGSSGTYPTLTGTGGLFEAINNNGLSGNTTALLSNGSITEPGTVALNAVSYGCVANLSLIIKPTAGATTILTGSNASALLKLNGADYVTIDGSNNGTTSKNLTITNTNTGASSAVIWLASTAGGNGATNNTIKNLTVMGNAPLTTLSAIISCGSVVSAVAEAPNSNNTFTNNTCAKAQYGIAVVGSVAGQTGVTITNNSIGSNTTTDYIGFVGLFASNSNGINITGNDISNIITSANNPTGIIIAANVTNSTIDRNMVRTVRYTGTGGYGGKGISISTGIAASNLRVSNNMVSGIGGDGWSDLAGDAIVGMRILGTTGGVSVDYNSINLTGSFSGNSTGTQSAAFYIASGVTDINLRNNIFVTSLDNTAIGTDKTWAINSAAANTAFTTIDYNDYYVSGAAGVLGYIGSDRTTLADIQTGFGSNTNSKNIQPVFVSTTDLHLIPGNNLGLDNAATPIAGITTDIDGETRNVTTPDVGADEFIVLALDASVTAIVLPSAFCPGSNLVSTTIKNLGSSTITSILIDWSITPGGAQTQVNPSINLAPGASLTIPLGNFTFVGGTSYTITASTSSPNGGVDGNTANDAFTQTNITTGLTGTYTVGVGGSYSTLTAAIADYNTKNLCGPVVFSLTDASYVSETFPITLNGNTAASSINTLTIRSAPGISTTISGSNATALLDLNGADWVVIDGSNNGTASKDLTLSNTNTGGAVIRFINDATNNLIANTILNGVSTSTTNGIVYFATTTGTTGNDNNTIQNNNIASGATANAYGIYNLGTTTSTATKNSGLQIIGNNIFNFSNTGIFDAGGSVGALYRGNQIYQVNTQTTSLTGFRPSATNIEGFTFTRNRIYDLKTTGTGNVYGIHLFDIQGSASLIGEISNNMISLDATAPLTMRGIYDQSATGEFYNLYHNTISLSGIVTGASNSEAYYWSIASTTNFRNNILVNNRNGGTGKHYAIRFNTTLANINSNYNDIYSGGGTGSVFGNDGTADRADLAAWQTNTNKDANSVSVQPTFVSAVDLHLVSGSNAGLDGYATPIAGITVDYDGQTRNATTPDMGADEFSNTGVLPANLLTFSGLRQGSANQLKWTVAQEADVQSYEVEKSENGRSWSRIGTVASLGNTVSQRSYGFADNNIAGLKQMYRLRQVDRTGAARLSNIVVITGVKPVVLVVSGLFPNPVISTTLNVLVDAPAKDNVLLTVTDVLGRVIKTTKKGVEAGSNTLQVDVTGLTPGSYLLKVTGETNNETVVGKFVKQ